MEGGGTPSLQTDEVVIGNPLVGRALSEIDSCRRRVVERLMRPLEIVKVEVGAEPAARLPDAFLVAQEDLLVLDAAPQTLDENVVENPAATVHADANASLFEHCGKLLARELRALVTVENLGPRARQSALETA